MSPEVLSPLQQELKSWHDKLSNLHPKYMFRLEKLRVLPLRCIDLKDDVPLCKSCMFGTERRRKWKTKCKKSGSIRKETGNKPGYVVSVDQLQTA